MAERSPPLDGIRVVELAGLAPGTIARLIRSIRHLAEHPI